jgi:hypothetical protein
MFPTDAEICQQIESLSAEEGVISEDYTTTGVKSRLTWLEDVRDLYSSTIICDLCSKRCRDVYYYNCSVCNFDNYDQCHSCFVEENIAWTEAIYFRKYPKRRAEAQTLMKGYFTIQVSTKRASERRPSSSLISCIYQYLVAWFSIP